MDHEQDGIETLWDARDVARYLKVSRSWVYQKAEAGLLPYLKVGGLVRFVPERIPSVRARVQRRVQGGRLALRRQEAGQVQHGGSVLQAELERRAERVRLGVEVALPDDGGGTLAALLEWWLDTYSKPTAGHETNRTTIRKHFLGSELAALSLAAVTSGRIEAFLQAKTAELAPQTINHLRSYLSRAFNAARRAGRWPGANPAQDVKKRKVPRRQPDYLRPHEVPLLLRALDPRWRPIFAAALYTGLRKGRRRRPSWSFRRPMARGCAPT